METKLVTTQPEPSTQVKISHDDAVISEGVLFLIPLCFASIWAIAVLLSGIPKVAPDRSLALKRSSKIPCRNCQFYSNNPYLRCAIRPTDALTDRAINCSDYGQPNPDR